MNGEAIRNYGTVVVATSARTAGGPHPPRGQVPVFVPLRPLLAPTSISRVYLLIGTYADTTVVRHNKRIEKNLK